MDERLDSQRYPNRRGQMQQQQPMIPLNFNTDYEEMTLGASGGLQRATAKTGEASAGGAGGADEPAAAAQALMDREHFFSRKSLGEIGTSSEAGAALMALGIDRPSKIQAIAHRQVLAGHHCIIAEQTGSGKTLAYLLPLVQRLREEERSAATAAGEDEEPRGGEGDEPRGEGRRGYQQQGGGRGRGGRPRGGLGPGRARPYRPRVVILAPTSELAQQVHGVARQLAGLMPFRCACFTGGGGRGSTKTQRSILEEGLDVLVATPGRVSTLLEDDVLNLEDARAVVLDEVDVLFSDDTFKLAPIGASAPDDAQFIFATATLPQDVADMVKAEFPGVKSLMGPGLHRVAPGVEEVLIDCSGPPEEVKTEETGSVHKREALVRQLKRHQVERTLVFCNTIHSCRQVENQLNRLDRQHRQFEVLAFHSAIDRKSAEANLQKFMAQNSLRPMVLICTDRSSRGMDFDRAAVDHVVLYDFPRDPVEYMRRVGRTARAGRKGLVTVLAWGRQVPLVREIMSGNKRGKKLLSLDTK